MIQDGDSKAVVLVLGPTGSGKSTILSKVRNYLNNPKKYDGAVKVKVRSTMGISMWKISEGKTVPKLAQREKTAMGARAAVGYEGGAAPGEPEGYLDWFGKDVTLVEVGGPMLSLWRNNTKNVVGVLFVIDGTNESTLLESSLHLSEILSHPSLSSTRVLVLFNKCDSSRTLSLDVLESHIGVSGLVTVEPEQLVRGLLPSRAMDGTHRGKMVMRYPHPSFGFNRMSIPYTARDMIPEEGILIPEERSSGGGEPRAPTPPRLTSAPFGFPGATTSLHPEDKKGGQQNSHQNLNDALLMGLWGARDREVGAFRCRGKSGVNLQSVADWLLQFYLPEVPPPWWKRVIC